MNTQINMNNSNSLTDSSYALVRAASMSEVFLEKEYGITEELIQAKMERIYQIPRETIPQSDANTPNTGHLPLSDPNYECGCKDIGLSPTMKGKTCFCSSLGKRKDNPITKPPTKKNKKN